ncbi:9064_t:CDS:2, partial [Racocetra fulgida]
LDDYPTDTDIDISHQNCFHAYDGRNRWFDKAIQVLVANNGHPPNASPIELSSPQYLKWVVDNSIMNTIQQAQINIQAAIDNLDSVLLHYNEYGSEWLKNAKVSPDAFVQMAMQLAYYKRYGEPCATYESASTRAFLHGRTETTRTCSVDTVAFTKAFYDPNVNKDEKISLLMKAIKSHTEYMISASNGLRCQIRDEEEKSKATLFKDPSYVQSMSFKLSTSNMSPAFGFHCGFGAVVPDGYGICYAIGKDKLKISISSYKKCKETD